MSMPGAVEMSQHYPSFNAFRRHQSELAQDGWSLEGFSMHGHAGWGRFIGLGRQAVDAHYIRSDWPTE